MNELDRLLGAQEAFAASVSSRRSQVMKRARWEKRADFYTRGQRVKATQMVTVDTDVQRMAFNFAKQAYPRMAAAFEKHMVPVALDAFNNWPVQTGLSKSLLALEFQPTQTMFSVEISNRAPYAVFINNNKRVSAASYGKDTYKTLIFQPAEKAADALAKDLADVLGD